MSNTSEMRKAFIDSGNQTGLNPVSKTSMVEIAVITAMYIGLVLAILAGNGLVLVVFTVNKRLRGLSNLLIRSLAVSDLLTGLVTCPCWVYIFVSQYCGPGGYSHNFYQFYITADIFFGSASILQLTAFSIERCHAIVRPLRHRLLSKKEFVAMILVPWLLASLVATLQPVQFERWTEVYTIITSVLFFFVPFVIICVAYSCIFKTTRSRRNLSRHRSRNDQQQNELKLSITVATITGLFAVSWLPLFVVTVIATFHAPYLPSPLWTDRLLKFVKFCHYGNSAMNPIIYAFRNKEVKDAYRHLTAKLACRPDEVESSDAMKTSSLKSKGSSLRKASGQSDGCKGNTATHDYEPTSQGAFAIESAV